MKRMLLLVAASVLLVVLLAPIVVQAYDNLLVIYMPGGEYWAFTFAGSDPQVNWDIQGDAQVSIDIDASGYQHNFYSEGDRVAGSLTASCRDLTQKAMVQDGIIYSITDADGTVIKLSFVGTYAELLTEISIDKALENCHVYVQMEVSGKNIWLEVVNGRVIAPLPASPPPPPPPPTLREMKACGIMMMQVRYGFSAEFAKFLMKEFGVLTIDRAMRDAGDDPDEFLVALYGYSLQDRNIENPVDNLIVFTFWIGNNFTGELMPRDASMKVHPNITVVRVNDDGRKEVIDLDPDPMKFKLFLVSDFDEETRQFRIVWDITGIEPGYYEIYLGNRYQDWGCFQMYLGEPMPDGKLPFDIKMPVN